jgi:hypothetical protein
LADGAGAAAASPVARKRSRPPRAQQLAGSARKHARVEGDEDEQEDDASGDDAAAAGYSDFDADAADAAPPPARSAREDRRQLSAAAPAPLPLLPAPPAAAAPAAPVPAAAPAAGAPQSELQRVEAFLRGIRPPLSQARLLLACCVRAEACIIADASTLVRSRRSRPRLLRCLPAATPWRTL